MLSLKDFREFEIKSTKMIIVGDPTTHTTLGPDFTENGNMYKDDGSLALIGCGCGNNAYSMYCCQEQ